MIMLLCIIGLLIIYKLYLVLTCAWCKSKVCLLGKTAVVTGGNSGIGYQIVLGLLSRGCRVIIADKVEDPDLKEKLFKETQSKNVDFKHVDLASFKSVREFANNLRKTEEKIDILINNAGVGNLGIITEDGLNATMQINYYSHFLLTHLIIDLLTKASGRIIFTSSLLSFRNNLSLESLKSDDNDVFYSYPNSKAGAIIAADVFAEKLKSFEVTSNSFHPFLVKTSIFNATRIQSAGAPRSSVWSTLMLIKILEILNPLIGKTAEEGAQTAIYLASANEVKGVTGEFFGEMAPTIRPKITTDKNFCQAFWRTCERIVKLEDHEKIVEQFCNIKK